MPPRIIYVTSSQGKPSSLSSPPSSDPQLLNAKDSYGASKYIGSIVTSRLDWELSQQGDDDEIRQITGSAGRKVRMLRLDPGVVHTGMFAQWLPLIMEWMMVVTFYIVSPDAWDNRRIIDFAENLCLSSIIGTMVRIETPCDLYRQFCSRPNLLDAHTRSHFGACLSSCRVLRVAIDGPSFRRGGHCAVASAE
jgi:hypothetical protein